MKAKDFGMTDEEVMGFIDQNAWYWYHKFKAEGSDVRLEELKGLVAEKLVVAMAKFCESKRNGAKFTTFATTCVGRAMADYRKVYLRKQERMVAYPICPVVGDLSEYETLRSEG